jgi:hypothetical protein
MSYEDMCFFVDEEEADDLEQRIIDALGERFEADETLTLDVSLAAVLEAMLMDIAKVCNVVVRNEIKNKVDTPSYSLGFDEIHKAGVVVGKLEAYASSLNAR